MADNLEMPPAEEPSNNNRTIIIVVAVLAILCCCCVAIGVLGWNFGDQILYELGI